MTHHLNKINPKFRQLTDLLFFTDRMDLDLSEFKALLKENQEIHFGYMWDRFKRATEIFWEHGEQFWSNRLTFLLELNEKTISSHVEEHLEKRMFHLVRIKEQVSIVYDIEYLQFLELCKVKNARQESLVFVKAQLTELPAHMKFEKIIGIVNSFIPIVFTDINEYTEAITKKITHSARSFNLLCALEQHGIKFDKQPIVKLAHELLFDRKLNEKNQRAFFTILNDTSVRAKLKEEYTPPHKDRLLALLDNCDYQIIEEHHLRNIKNLIELDPTIGDELAVMYADKLYSRNTGHKKANADRLIRLLKTIPQIAPKRILAYLSSNNKMSDIKYVLSAFPDLRKLAAFV